MKTAVTGGGGFLGSAIIRELKNIGIEPVCVGRSRYPHLSDVEQIQADLTDPVACMNAFKNCEAVIHTAAKAGFWGQWEDFYQSNVVATSNVIHACRKLGIGRLVYTSSPSVIAGSNDLIRINEEIAYPDRYLAHYPKTKAMAELSIKEVHQAGVLHTIILRPHLIWGEGDPHLTPRFIARARQNRLFIVGDGQNLVDTVHVDNAALAHVLALKATGEPGHPALGQTYFVSQDEPMPLWDWINRFITGRGLKPITRKIPASLAYAVGHLLETLTPETGSEPRMTRFLAQQLSHHHTYNLTNIRRDLAYHPRLNNDQAFALVLHSDWFMRL